MSNKHKGIVNDIGSLIKSELAAELLAEYIGAIAIVGMTVSKRNALMQDIDLNDADEICKELQQATERMINRIEQEYGTLELDTSNGIREVVLNEMVTKARQLLDDATDYIKDAADSITQKRITRIDNNLS